MQLRVNKQILSLSLLLVFLLLRITNLHAVVHSHEIDHHLHNHEEKGEDENEDNQCELCELFITSQKNTPFSNNSTSTIMVKDIVPIDPEVRIPFYKSPLERIVCPIKQYNRPPPSH